MMDVQSLTVFQAVVTHAHFGRAARYLNMSQPNVSLHIKNLELSLGTTLIERSPFRLTESGYRLLETAKTVLKSIHACRFDIQAMEECTSGELTIACSDYIAQELLMPALTHFQSNHPLWKLRLLNTTSQKAGLLVESATADLGLMMNPPDVPSLHVEVIESAKWIAIGTHDHIQAIERGDPVPLISLGKETRTHHWLSKHWTVIPFEGVVAVEVGSVSGQINWAEAGFGIAILPNWGGQFKNEQVEIMELNTIPKAPLGLVQRLNFVPSKLSRAFLGYLR